MVGVGSWGMYYVSESPHRDRNVRMCVCVFVPIQYFAISFAPLMILQNFLLLFYQITLPAGCNVEFNTIISLWFV